MSRYYKHHKKKICNASLQNENTRLLLLKLLKMLFAHVDTMYIKNSEIESDLYHISWAFVYKVNLSQLC